MALDIRRWTRNSCGVVQDRDVNAARNIRDYRPGAPGCLTVEANGKTGAVPALAGEAATRLPDPDYVDNLR